MRMKWWLPLVALPVGLLALLAVGSAVNPEVGTRLKRSLHEFMPDNGSTLKMDDGVHVLYVAWNDGGVQDAAVDDKTVPVEQVSVEDGVVRLRGVTDAEGWPLYEQVSYSEDAQRRTLPGDALERLGLRFAAAPDAAGGWPVRADGRAHSREHEAPQSPAQIAGVQTGDVLVEVDGLRPPSPEGLKSALQAALEARSDDAALPIVVRRAGTEFTIVLHPLALNGQNFWAYVRPEAESQDQHGEQGEAQGTTTSR